MEEYAEKNGDFFLVAKMFNVRGNYEGLRVLYNTMPVAVGDEVEFSNPTSSRTFRGKINQRSDDKLYVSLEIRSFMRGNFAEKCVKIN